MHASKILPAYLQREELSLSHGKNVLQPKVSGIKTEFLSENNENYIGLTNNLQQYKNIFSICLLECLS